MAYTQKSVWYAAKGNDQHTNTLSFFSTEHNTTIKQNTHHITAHRQADTSTISKKHSNWNISKKNIIDSGNIMVKLLSTESS